MSDKKGMSPEQKRSRRPLKEKRTHSNKLKRILKSCGLDAATAYAKQYGLTLPRVG